MNRNGVVVNPNTPFEEAERLFNRHDFNILPVSMRNFHTFATRRDDDTLSLVTVLDDEGGPSRAFPE